jgi:hypothetical protein
MMKHTITIAAAFFSTAIMATRNLQPQITITVTNEFTGDSGSATVQADGHLRRISDLFKSTDVDYDGKILGTSSQLALFASNVFCSFNNDETVIPINSTTPLVDLDGNPNVALRAPLILNSFQFQCQI